MSRRGRKPRKAPLSQKGGWGDFIPTSTPTRLHLYLYLTPNRRQPDALLNAVGRRGVDGGCCVSFRTKGKSPQPPFCERGAVNGLRQRPALAPSFPLTPPPFPTLHRHSGVGRNPEPRRASECVLMRDCCRGSFSLTQPSPAGRGRRLAPRLRLSIIPALCHPPGTPSFPSPAHFHSRPCTVILALTQSFPRKRESTPGL